MPETMGCLLLFIPCLWISKIHFWISLLGSILRYHKIIMDIQKYPKLFLDIQKCILGYPLIDFWISIIHFWISKNRFMDILKYIIGYPKIMLNFGYP